MKKTNKNTKNKQKIKQNKTKRTKNTKRTRKNVKKGGEYVDAGTFGAVYTNPRLLCQGEDLSTPNINNEVSKIFEYDDDAEYENNNIEKLKSFLNERGILEELQQYAIIPKKMCNVNRDVLTKPPYTYDSWMRNQKFEYNENIFNKKYARLPHTTKILNDNRTAMIDIPAYNKLIISDKGGDNLYKIIEKIATYDQFKDFLQKLSSIGQGIQLLQNNGLIHGDIKDKNCLEHNGRFKIIDLSDIREISTTKDPAAMPTAFGYQIWPITAFYTYLFDEGIVFDKIEDIDTIITFDQIKTNFSEGNYDNYNMHGISYSKVLFDSAFRTKNIGYTPEQSEMIENIKRDLMNQKTTFVNNDRFLRDDIIEEFNSMVISEFTDINEFKMDLFKRIDIYSFGILILQCISRYLNKNYRTVIDDPKFCEKMIELYGIIKKCCYQKERVANINEIIPVYKAVVSTM